MKPPWLLLAAALSVGIGTARAGVLRVCAAPDNLPFSNRAGAGFENKIVALIAKDLGDTVHYTWWRQRNSLIPARVRARHCALWLGVPAASPP